MNKKDLIKKMNEIIIELKINTNIDAWRGGYLCAIAECLEWVNELDEQKVEECEFNYIDYVHSYDGDYEGEVFQCSNCEKEYSPEDVIGVFNYCPTCGRKIKKGE